MSLISSILATVLLSVVSADPPGARAAPPPPSTKSKKKVIRLDALMVDGRIQKPQAFYILQRSNMNFEELSRPESFIPKINKIVEEDPLKGPMALTSPNTLLDGPSHVANSVHDRLLPKSGDVTIGTDPRN